MKFRDALELKSGERIIFEEYGKEREGLILRVTERGGILVNVTDQKPRWVHYKNILEAAGILI